MAIDLSTIVRYVGIMLYEDLYKKTESANTDAEDVKTAPVSQDPPAEDSRALLRMLALELVPAKRLALLREGLQFWPEDELLKALGTFFALRYPPIKNAATPYADRLLGLQMELQSAFTLFHGRRLLKHLHRLMSRSPLIRWADMDEAPHTATRQDLLFGEWMNVLNRYADTCRHDKHYASTLFGLLKANEAQVERHLYAGIRDLDEGLASVIAVGETDARFAWTPTMRQVKKATGLILEILPGGKL